MINWNQNEKKIDRGETEALMEVIWISDLWMSFIRRNYEWNTERMELLKKIFLDLCERKQEEAEQEIYRYGSLIREQDFIARQMFLWLLALIEENEQTAAT